MIDKPAHNIISKRTSTRVPLTRVLTRNQFATINAHQTIRERAQLIHEEETGQYLKYQQLLNNPKYATQWARSAANEFGQLVQGVRDRIKGTNTIHFIAKRQVPIDQATDITYGSFSCDYKPNKEEKKDKTHSRR